MATEKSKREVLTARIIEITGSTPKDVGDGQYVSRLESAVMLASALPPLNTGIAGHLMPPYSDIDTLSNEEKDALRTLYHVGIMMGYPDGTFGPTCLLTTSEADLTLERTQRRVQAAKKPVEYEVVSDTGTLPQQVQDQAAEVAGATGIVTVQTADSTYAILSAGERNTGGFAIQVITYPQLILRYPQTNQPIVVVNEKELAS